MSPDARFQYGLDHVLNGIAAALPDRLLKNGRRGEH
jgi:hypothetical protein